MEVQISIRGTESQINHLLAETNLFEILVKKGQIVVNTDGDNPEMIDAIWALSYETVHLAHIIATYGNEDTKGKYMTREALLAHKLNSKGVKFASERNLSARVGGAKKLTGRLGLPDILRSKVLSSGEKRYYLTLEALPSFEQVLVLYDERYRDWLEDKGFSYPHT
jgi:hypothetical protein